MGGGNLKYALVLIKKKWYSFFYILNNEGNKMSLSPRYLRGWATSRIIHSIFGYVPIDVVFTWYRLSFSRLENLGLFKYNKKKAMRTSTMFGYDLTKEGKRFFKESFFYHELFLLKPWKRYAFMKYMKNVNANNN